MTALLLTDDDGSAWLFSTATHDLDRAARHFQGAENTNEPPFKSAYLITDTGDVLLAASAITRTQFGSDDYATWRVAFTAADAAYEVSWRIDGRT